MISEQTTSRMQWSEATSPTQTIDGFSHNRIAPSPLQLAYPLSSLLPLCHPQLAVFRISRSVYEVKEAQYIRWPRQIDRGRQRQEHKAAGSVDRSSR
jgi:hypothetical protein